MAPYRVPYLPVMPTFLVRFPMVYGVVFDSGGDYRRMLLILNIWMGKRLNKKKRE